MHPLALVFLSVTVCAVRAQSPPCDDSSCPTGAAKSTKVGFKCMRTYTLPSGPYHVYWTVDGTLLKMALEATTTGWIGIAFAKNAGVMVPSDFIVGIVDGASVSVTPYYSEIRTPSAFQNTSGTITLTDVKGEEANGTTTVYFTRDTAQTGNVSIDLTAVTPINFAIGFEDILAYHGPRRNFGTITFA